VQVELRSGQRLWVGVRDYGDSSVVHSFGSGDANNRSAIDCSTHDHGTKPIAGWPTTKPCCRSPPLG
jgi:hypothetical protein